MVPWPDPNPDMSMSPGLEAGSQSGQNPGFGEEESGHDRPDQDPASKPDDRGPGSTRKYLTLGGQHKLLGNSHVLKTSEGNFNVRRTYLFCE